MRRAWSEKKVDAVLVAAEAIGAVVHVRFAPRAGVRGEIEDRIELGPRGSLASVIGVGRLLRILRAGRVPSPAAPYTLDERPEHAAELLRRCAGATVCLTLARRFDRSLTVWTESGVEQISRVIDYEDEADCLTVRTREGNGTRVIPRHQLIRYAPSATEYLEVISVDVPPRSRLR